MPAVRLKILVGVDFSPESRAALREARDLARRTRGLVTVAHVRPTSDVRAAVVEERGDLIRRRVALGPALEAHYARRLERIRRPVSSERVALLEGEPAAALCREARRNYNVLVLGSRGRGGVASFLLGSTVQEALARSPVPVLVVRG